MTICEFMMVAEVKASVSYKILHHADEINSICAIGDLCCLLTTFANSLGPGQNPQIVGPVLDPNHLTP